MLTSSQLVQRHRFSFLVFFSILLWHWWKWMAFNVFKKSPYLRIHFSLLSICCFPYYFWLLNFHETNKKTKESDSISCVFSNEDRMWGQQSITIVWNQFELLTIIIGTDRRSSGMAVRARSSWPSISQTFRWISFNMHHFELFVGFFGLYLMKKKKKKSNTN